MVNNWYNILKFHAQKTSSTILCFSTQLGKFNQSAKLKFKIFILYIDRKQEKKLITLFFLQKRHFITIFYISSMKRFTIIGIVLIFLPFFVSSSPQCSICSQSIQTLGFIARHLIPTSIAAEILDILCVRKYSSKDLCKKVGEQVAPIALENLIQNYLNSDQICSFFCGKIYHKYNPDEQVFRILTNNSQQKPWQKYKINLQLFIRKAQVEIQLQSQQLNILHLSDIHLDTHYTENASIFCSYPLCCHPQHGFPQNPAAQAKPFGSKNCDCPIKLFDSMLDSMNSLEEQIQIVVATGDFSAHNQWQKTKESIIYNNNLIKQKILNTPKLKDSLFIRAEGNNDYSPDHQFDASGIEGRNLVQITTIKDSKTNKTIAFIILNTISFDNFNLFLLGDQSYAIFQLMILEKYFEMYDQIYLIGHIPPTLDQTAETYAKVLRALIARYSAKIIVQLYGHTHADQLTINTHPGDSSFITNFAFITPSVSPYNVGRSKYRIYRMANGDKSGISDYTQYMLKDLNSQTAEWIVDYSFRQRYKIDSSPQLPITKEDIKKIVKIIMDQNTETRKTYLQGSGIDGYQNSPFYCYILDDPLERKKCSKTLSATFSSKLYTLLEIIRGPWGFDTKNAELK